MALVWGWVLAGQEEKPVYDVGQHFILVLPEGKTNEELNQWLEQCKPAGVMLLESHCSERKKTKKLIEQLQKTAVKIGIPPLIVAVDWEGGIISRMNEAGGFISVPSPYALARIGRSACFCAGMIIGKQLRDIGVTCNFAPSVDLFNKDSAILATRCFSPDQDVVAGDAIAFAHGLLVQGIVPVVKHFPGLGLGNADSHLEGVSLELDETLFKRQTQPFFDAIKAGLPCVMGSHARCSQCDNLPATLSMRAIDMLKQANPDILCITDDFSMKGVQSDMSLARSVVVSLQAGYHLIIYKGTAQEEIDLLKAVSQEQKQSLYEQVCQQRAREMAILKEKLFGKTDVQTNITFVPETLAQKLARGAIKINNRRNRLFSKKAKGDIQLITVDLPKMRLDETWFIGKDRKSYLSTAIPFMTGRTVNEQVLDPYDDQSFIRLGQILRKCKRDDDIIIQTFFFGSGAACEMQTMWLELVGKIIEPQRVTIFSLGHPMEHLAMPKATIVQLGSFHNPMIDAALYHLTTRPTITGAQKLVWHPERYLKGKRFGLLCHKASCAMIKGQQAFLPDVLHTWARGQNDQTRLVALFSPEHGLLGSQEAGISVVSELVSKWGCPIYSLCGIGRAPTIEMLQGLDVLVIDLQDVGVRCTTSISTLVQMLEVAQRQEVKVLVLDRPNPIKYWDASGPMLDQTCESFLGKVYTKFLYGITIGQLAKDINKTVGADLKVLPCNGGQESDDCYFNQQFVAPSPNLTTVEAVHTYPITVFIEGTNYSEGRGTLYPYQQIGAPWIDAQALAQKLNGKKCAGIYFEPISFTPQAINGKRDEQKHEGALCGGVFINIIDNRSVNPTQVGRVILETLFEMYPEQSTWTHSGKRYLIDLLVGIPDWRAEITASAKA